MLRDERKTDSEALPTHANPLRSEIESQIEAFLAKGGKIQEAGNDPANKPVIFNPAINLGSIENIHVVRQKNRAKVKAKSGHQNIRKLKDGWSVQIGCIRSDVIPTIQEAIELRDRQRETMGLPPADY